MKKPLACSLAITLGACAPNKQVVTKATLEAMAATIQPTGKFELWSSVPGKELERKKFDSLEICEVALGTFLKAHQAANDKALADWQRATEKNQNSTFGFATAMCLPDTQT